MQFTVAAHIYGIVIVFQLFFMWFLLGAYLLLFFAF